MGNANLKNEVASGERVHITIRAVKIPPYPLPRDRERADLCAAIYLLAPAVAAAQHGDCCDAT